MEFYNSMRFLNQTNVIKFLLSQCVAGICDPSTVLAKQSSFFDYLDLNTDSLCKCPESVCEVKTCPEPKTEGLFHQEILVKFQIAFFGLATLVVFGWALQKIGSLRLSKSGRKTNSFFFVLFPLYSFFCSFIILIFFCFYFGFTI